MRILHIVHSLPPYEMAGTPILTWQLARAQAAAGHEVFLFSRLDDLNVKDGETHDEAREGCQIRFFHRHEVPWRPLARSYQDEEAERAFLAYVAEVRPEVLHIQHLLGLGMGVMKAARKLDLPLLLTLHDFWLQCPMGQRTCTTDDQICEPIDFQKCGPCVYGPSYAEAPVAARGFAGHFAQAMRERPGQFARRPRAALDAMTRSLRDLGRGRPSAPENPFIRRYELFREATQAVDLVIGTSEFILEQFQRGFDLSPEKSLFLANGMDYSAVTRLPKTAAPRVRFGFVGSLIRTKGVGILLEGFLAAALQRDDIELHIHGTSNRWSKDFEEALKTRAAESAAHARVLFHGRFDNHRIGEVHAGLDWLVVPSIWFENSPLVLNEAALTQTPVIASDRGGMEEFVRTTGWGRSFELGSAESLAQVLVQVAEETRAGLKLPPPPAIKTIEASAAQTLQIYAELAAGRWKGKSPDHQRKTRGGILNDPQWGPLV